ncbi:four helix bundle protein [Psychroflexus aurantiacus]|nr:four helix bundle protein [Psychroflexus aurantiacus]
MKLVDQNYLLTATLPDYEKFGLRIQMNRCSVSIASNISEGPSKRTNKHFTKVLGDSLGSAYEWVTQLMVCYPQKFISEKNFLVLEEKYKHYRVKFQTLMTSWNQKFKILKQKSLSLDSKRRDS